MPRSRAVRFLIGVDKVAAYTTPLKHYPGRPQKRTCSYCCSLGAVTVIFGIALVCYRWPMHNLRYHRHLRFPFSFRDVKDLLAERGIDVSYETIRRGSVKFGLAYAKKLRRSYPPADTRWHRDEAFGSINGKTMYLWPRGLRRRGSRCPGPITMQQESCAETGAQVTQRTRLRSNCGHDG